MSINPNWIAKGPNQRPSSSHRSTVPENVAAPLNRALRPADSGITRSNAGTLVPNNASKKSVTPGPLVPRPRSTWAPTASCERTEAKVSEGKQHRSRKTHTGRGEDERERMTSSGWRTEDRSGSQPSSPQHRRQDMGGADRQSSESAQGWFPWRPVRLRLLSVAQVRFSIFSLP